MYTSDKLVVLEGITERAEAHRNIARGLTKQCPMPVMGICFLLSTISLAAYISGVYSNLVWVEATPEGLGHLRT